MGTRTYTNMRGNMYAIAEEVGFREIYAEVYDADGERIEWTRTEAWDWLFHWLNNHFDGGWVRDKYAHNEPRW